LQFGDSRSAHVFSPSGGYAGELSRRGSGLSLARTENLHAGKAAICFMPFVNETWFLSSPDISIPVVPHKAVAEVSKIGDL